MALVEVVLPAMGEGIIEATLISWMKNEGDTVSIDENLIEVATDKVNSEVPSTVAGILKQKLFGDNDIITVGKPFAIISTGGDDTTISVPPAPVVETSKVEIQKAETPVAPVIQNITSNPEPIINFGDRFYSPLVMNIAKEEGINQAELDSIAGSGKDGRLTKDDLMAYIATRGTGLVSNLKVEPVSVAPIIVNTPTIQTQIVENQGKKNDPIITPIDFGPHVEVQKMDRMRKLIGEHMIKSLQVSPHVCSFVEADMTNIVTWRNAVKDKFKAKYGVGLTFTPIIIEVIAKALRDFPMINASVDGENVLIKKEVNIGMAAALPDGNLIVPVIKNADTLNLLGLAQKVSDLGQRAKKNQLKPDEIQGGTYTMTNLGSFGNLFGTPIINQPQVAILGVGAIVKKPVVIEDKDGDSIGIRSMMYLSHSYDHRIVDGMMGGSFVKRVAEYLEAWDMNREI
jgi:2-oxoglutarate dehydrogenase E2 component (dihydrolipoamide succinyltransferase)